MVNDFSYWKGQIESAKQEHAKYWTEAKECNDAYSKERDYNIFYSNVNVLEASLLTTLPRPDIQRRFQKRLESDRLKSNTYAEVAKVVSGAVEFYEDQTDFMNRIKKTVHNSVKIGRGVTWVEYDPVIEETKVAARNIKIISLDYDEFLASSANSPDQVWWMARRHLLTADDLKNRFAYEAEEVELKFGDQSETQKKRGEVWEIWDKSEKKRIFLLTTSKSGEFLAEQEDPYKLEVFFPCDPLAWLTNGRNIVPIPEYKIYRKKARELDNLSKKCSDIESQVKYVIATNNSSKDTAAQIAQAGNGQVIAITSQDPGRSISEIIGTVPVDTAAALVEHIEMEKDRVKQDIYDITGISDLMRGMSDARETATAQKIKGLYGSLRFNNRQAMVQDHIKKVFRIMAELICEHWDAETLAVINATNLPDMMEKVQIAAQAQQSGGGIPADRQDILDTPTWDDVMRILQSDRMRNFTIDIETSATVFDDHEALTANIGNLTQAYLNMVNAAAALKDPNLIRGFIPIMRMNISNIKVSSAVSAEIEAALEAAVKSLEDSKNQPPPPSPEDKKLQSDMEMNRQKLMADAAEKDKDRQADMQIQMARISADKELAVYKLQIERGYLADQNAATAIKGREEGRKQEELDAQVLFKTYEIQSGRKIDPNIPGDVRAIE